MFMRPSRLRFITITLLILCLLAPAALAAQTETPRDTYQLPPYKTPENPTLLDKQLLETMEKFRVVGLAAAVFTDNKLVWKGGYGWSNLETGRTVTYDTLFRAASISKMVTATALMQLYEQGRFKLDDDISQYLGYEVRNPNYPDDKITFRQLLTHTSSIVDSGAYDTILQGPLPLTDIDIKELLVPDGQFYEEDTFANYQPGSNFCYSNFGTMIIGRLIEKLSGLSFEKYCSRYIFSPLNMDAGFEPADIKNWKNIAVLYRPDADLENYTPTKDNFHETKPSPTAPHVPGAPVHSPAGGLRASCPDLAKFLQAHMNGGTYKNTRILKSDTADLMHSIQWFGNSMNGFYKQKGLNFHITDDLVPGKRLIGHAGEAYGLVGDAYYDPDRNLGMVFLINGAHLTADATPYYAVENAVATTLFTAFAPKRIPPKQLKAKSGAEFITVNDRKIFLQTPVAIAKPAKNPILFLPAIAVADALGTTLEQNDDSFTFTYEQNKATLAAGQIAMLVNNKEVLLPLPPYLHNGQLLVPVRAVAEALKISIKISL